MNRYKAKQIISGTISNLLKIAVTAFFIFPFYWMVITSFKTPFEASQFPPTLWPIDFSIRTYEALLSNLGETIYLKNSLIIVISILIIQLVIMIPAAYAFARYKFKGNGLMFGLVTIAFMTPVEVTFLSIYLMFSKAGLIRTLLPQILPFAANAFGIFLLRQTFKQVPEEILESARLDNAGEIKIMTKIMLPTALPTIMTILVLSFMERWNDYFWPLVMTTTNEVQPLTILISQFSGAGPTAMTANCLLMLPSLILFLIASRQITSAMTYHGVK